MARGDGPDHDEADEGTSIERGGDPPEAADPSAGRPARAATGLGVLVALVAGGIVGFVLGGGAGDDGTTSSDAPDLQALCIVIGTLDDDALDRLDAGDFSLDDPLLFRVSALPQLAQAAGQGAEAPEGLAEVATQFNEGVTRMQSEEIRTHVDELRTYC